MLRGNWQRRVDTAGSVAGPDDPRIDVVTTIMQGHVSPCLTLQRSPIIPELYLTTGDWYVLFPWCLSRVSVYLVNFLCDFFRPCVLIPLLDCRTFTLWMTGVDAPIFKSSYTSGHITCARWSPTRASVLFIGKSDGNVEVWELLDQSHRASISQNISPQPITALEFWHWHDTRGHGTSCRSASRRLLLLLSVLLLYFGEGVVFCRHRVDLWCFCSATAWHWRRRRHAAS